MVLTFSHLDAHGAARMVDVSVKPSTARSATASATVVTTPAVIRAIRAQAVAKGDVLAVARLAGIQAAKRTADLIPLCHPLALEAVHVSITLGRCAVRIRATCTLTGRTGVEMEALTAAAVAALTVYDMCKSLDRGMEIGPIRLEAKMGGRSGTWRRSANGIAAQASKGRHARLRPS